MAIDVEAYYRKYAPMVFRRCRQILKNDDMAKDAMQDVFVKLMHYQDKLRDEYPSSLLYKIATNTCLNIIRQQKKSTLQLNETVLDTIAWQDDPHGSFEILDVLKNIFKSEKASTRVIAYMHYVDGLTLEQTAKENGLSVSGVRKRLRILKEKVRNLNLEVE